MDRFIKASRWVSAIITFAVMAYYLVCLWSMYAGGLFHYQDLTLLNDLLSNAIREWRPFRVTDYGFNHLSIHFTPTLILLSPLAWVFQDQFFFLLAGTLGFFLGVAAYLRVLERVWRPRRPLSRLLVPCAFVALLVLGKFTKTVLVSAHFEILYVPLAGLVLALLLGNARPVAVAAVTLLACGVRQDAGFFLAFQSLALLLLPRASFADPPRARRLALGVAGLSLLYTLFAVKLAMPFFGAEPANHLRLWSGLGSSWGEIFWNILTSPLAVTRQAWHSGFKPLNASFFWLPFVHPLFGLLANLPGVAFFMSSLPAKKDLWEYNSAFLLPGLFVGTALGLSLLWRLGGWAETRLAGRWRRAGSVLGALLSLGLVGAVAVERLRYLPETHGVDPIPMRFHARDVRGAFVAALRGELGGRPGIRSVATDFGSLVFVPNRLGRYLLRNFAAADMVILVAGADPFLSGGASILEVRERIERSGEFVLVSETQGISFFVRKEFVP